MHSKGLEQTNYFLIFTFTLALYNSGKKFQPKNNGIEILLTSLGTRKCKT